MSENLNQNYIKDEKVVNEITKDVLKRLDGRRGVRKKNGQKKGKKVGNVEKRWKKRRGLRGRFHFDTHARHVYLIQVFHFIDRPGVRFDISTLVRLVGYQVLNSVEKRTPLFRVVIRYRGRFIGLNFCKFVFEKFFMS